MPNISTELAAKLTDHQIALLRVAEGTNARIRALLVELEKDIANMLAQSQLSEGNERRLLKVMTDARAYMEAAYQQAAVLNDSVLVGLIPTEFAINAKIINRTLGIDYLSTVMPTQWVESLVKSFLVQGTPVADWWDRQEVDFAFKLQQELRLGLVSGETNAQLISRFRDLVPMRKRDAEAVVRTTVQTVSTNTKLDLYKRNSDLIKGTQQISTLDLRTTDICIAYDHQTWDLDGNPINGSTLPFNGGPPRHWNCRSVLIPLLVSYDDVGLKMEIPRGTRASMDGQVASDMTFEDWFASRGKAEQDRILGKGKADLWRRSKITMRDLLDQRGNPLSLEELRNEWGL